jgi:uncharacterized protein involved in exopolysaccharide biosynthesis
MKKNNKIFQLILILAKEKKVIIWITLLAAFLAVIYSLLTPQIWTSKTTFKPDASSSMSLPFNVSGLGGIMSSLIGGGSNDAQGTLIILNSRTFSESVIRKFKLIPYFKIEEPDTLKAMDKALERFRGKMRGISLNTENGLFSVSISSKSKELSKSIAEYYISQLDVYNREVKLTKGKRNRQFFEQRVAAVRNDIDSLSIAMKDFQQKNKAIDVTSQTSSVVSLYADVVSQKMIADMELDVARQNYDANSPVVKNLLQRQELFNKKITELEKGSSNIKPGYIIDIDKIPDLTQKYTQLMINLEIQKKVFEYIYPQFEAAKIEELKDMPTIEVIDPPSLAGMRSAPRRAIICIFASFLGFLLSLCVAFVNYQIEHNREIVNQIKVSLFGGKTKN